LAILVSEIPFDYVNIFVTYIFSSKVEKIKSKFLLLWKKSGKSISAISLWKAVRKSSKTFFIL
jgi:hypothetical protein